MINSDYRSNKEQTPGPSSHTTSPCGTQDTLKFERIQPSSLDDLEKSLLFEHQRVDALLESGQISGVYRDPTQFVHKWRGSYYTATCNRYLSVTDAINAMDDFTCLLKVYQAPEDDFKTNFRNKGNGRLRVKPKKLVDNTRWLFEQESFIGPRICYIQQAKAKRASRMHIYSSPMSRAYKKLFEESQCVESFVAQSGGAETYVEESLYEKKMSEDNRRSFRRQILAMKSKFGVSSDLSRYNEQKRVSEAKKNKTKFKNSFLTDDFVAQVNIGLVHKLDKQTIEVISKATDRFARVLETCGGNFGETVNEVKDTIDNGVSTIGSLKNFLWIALAVVFGYLILFKAPTHRVLLVAVLAAVLPAVLWQSISHIFSDQFVPQGPLNMSWMSSLITISLTYFFFSGGGLFTTCKNIFKFMPSYTRTVSGVGDLASFLVGCIEACFNYVRSLFGKGPVSISNTGKVEVDRFLSRVDEVVSQSSTETMPPREFLLSLQDLRQQGSTLLLTNRWSPIYQRPIERCINQLDKLIAANAPAIHAMKSSRIEPTLVGLIGPPRIGKTLIMNALTNVLLAASLDSSVLDAPDYDPKQHVYARCSCNEYWTGYYRQHLVINDDFGQALPVGGETNCYAELINMCSSAPFCPSQAAVEDKGRYYFDSKFVILTTNLLTLKDAHRVVASPDALAERLELSYKIRPKSNFLMRSNLDREALVLDGEKFKMESERIGDFPWHIWDFIPYNFSCSKESTPIGHQEFLKRIVDRYHRNKRRFEGVSNLDLRLTELGRSFRPQMGIPWFKKKQPKSHPIEIETQSDESGRPVEELTKLRDELRDEVSKINTSLLSWLSSDTFKLVTFLLATPFVLKLILGKLSGFVSYIIGSLGKVFGVGVNEAKKKRDTNIKAFRRLVGDLSDEELDQTVKDVAGKVSSKPKNRLNKLCSKILAADRFVPQSNVPGFREVYQRTIRKPSETMKAQIGTQKETLNDGLAKNQFLVIRNKEGEGMALGTLTVLENDFCMIPNHFIDHLKHELGNGSIDSKTTIRLSNVWTPKHIFEIPVTVFVGSRVHIDDEKDLAILKISSLQRRRSIVDKFILKADVEYLQKCDVRLESTRCDTDSVKHYIYYGKATRQLKVHVAADVPYTLLSGWVYDVGTKHGDCGGLVSLVDNEWTGKRRIIGFHCAGNGTRGIATGITQEYIKDILKGLGSISNVGLPDDTISNDFFSQTGNGEALFVVDDGVSQNPSSKLFQTPLHNAWYHSDKLPALLSAKPGLDPLEKVRAKYLRPHKELDQALVNRCVKTAFRPFKMASVGDSRRILTFREAVAGCPGLNNGFKGLKRGTSAGYPYNARHYDGKKDFFGKDGEFTFDSPQCKELEKEVTRIEDLARQNIRSVHIYTDFLKDELRSKEKVLEGNSRMISAAPLAFTILFRKYFGAFCSSVEKHRILTGPAVGINPYTEWDLVVRTLETKGPYIVAGDYGGFDHTSRPQNQDAMLVEANDWYDDEHTVIRNVLWKELTNSVHLTGEPGSVARLVYSWVGGMPSGFPGTTTVNCFDNITDMIIAYTKTTSLAPETFWDKVALIVYGDDNIMSIDPTVVESFNQLTIPTAMEEIGRKYTDDKKGTDAVRPYRSLSEVTFLKRSFVKQSNRWLAPLDIESTLIIPYWGKTKMGKDKILGDMVECTLQELSLHSQEVWDTYAKKILKSSESKAGYVPKLPLDRREYQNAAGNRTEMWF